MAHQGQPHTPMEQENPGMQPQPTPQPASQSSMSTEEMWATILAMREQINNMNNLLNEQRSHNQPATPASVPNPGPPPNQQHVSEHRGIIKTRDPEEFVGYKHKAQSFWMDCEMFLKLNHHIYDTDDKKIIYILSYMYLPSTAFMLFSFQKADAKTHHNRSRSGSPSLFLRRAFLAAPTVAHVRTPCLFADSMQFKPPEVSSDLLE